MSKDETVEPGEIQIEAKVVNIDMKTLVATFSFPENVDIENATACYNNCENVLVKPV